MKISPINNSYNLNENTAPVCRRNQNFGHAVFESDLNVIFASPQYAKPFVEAFTKLHNTKLNLVQIMDFYNLRGSVKEILEKFFNRIGSEADDYTVNIKVMGDYTNDSWKYPNCFCTGIYGRLPESERYHIGNIFQYMESDKFIEPNKLIAGIDRWGKEEVLYTEGYRYKEYYKNGDKGIFDADLFKVDEFKTGRAPYCGDNNDGGVSVYLPTEDSLKKAVHDSIIKQASALAKRVDLEKLKEQQKVEETENRQKMFEYMERITD